MVHGIAEAYMVHHDAVWCVVCVECVGIQCIFDVECVSMKICVTARNTYTIYLWYKLALEAKLG